MLNSGEMALANLENASGGLLKPEFLVTYGFCELFSCVSGHSVIVWNTGNIILTEGFAH